MLGYEAAFIDQGHDGSILDGIFAGIGRLNDSTKPCNGRLILRKNRSSGKAHITGHWQQAVHAARKFTILGAMTLIDQNDDVRVQVLESGGSFHRRLEFIDDRRDDVRRLLLDHRQQLGAGASMTDFAVAVLERLLDLDVQFRAVRHDNQARVLEFLIEGERLAQHDHRQGFTRALRVPDQSPRSLTLGIAFLHLLDDSFDSKELLMAGNLTLTVIEEGKRACQIKDALLATESMEDAILLGHGNHASLSELIIVTSSTGETSRKNILQLILRERAVDQASDKGVIMVLSPFQPELASRAHGSVEDIVLIRSDQQLHRVKQGGNCARRLIR